MRSSLSRNEKHVKEAPAPFFLVHTRLSTHAPVHVHLVDLKGEEREREI
jgi:hypothetical protein